MIKRYRTKLIFKEAYHWTDAFQVPDIERWMNQTLEGNKNGTGIVQELIIPTLEGEMTATIGDYIVKGLQGEFYPCKPNIFEKTYEDATTHNPTIRAILQDHTLRNDNLELALLRYLEIYRNELLGGKTQCDQ